MSSLERFLNPHLNFNGCAEDAFNFYKSVLGGMILGTHRYKDVPHDNKMPEAEKEKIMHIVLELKDGTRLMGNDNIESRGMPLVEGNNFSLSLHPESEQEAEKLFNALSEGGKVTMPLQKTFWNAYFGMLTDKFGTQWMINYEYPAGNK